MIKEALLLITKNSAKVLFRFLILFVPFAIMNVFFLIFEGTKTFNFFFQTYTKIYFLPFIAFIAVFLVIFPVVYFILAKKTAVKYGLNLLLNENKKLLISYILEKLVDSFEEKVLNSEKLINFLETKKNIVSLIKASGPLLWIIKYFLSKFRFTEILTNILKNTDINESNLDNYAEIIAEKLNESTEINLLNKTNYSLIISLFVNITLWVLSVIFFT